MADVEFDYVVVGAGAAGSVLAGRLASADHRVSVLLLEYGGPARNPLLRVPKGFYYTLRGDRYLYRYVTNPVGPGRAHEVWLRGRVAGGSAAVNGMMWMRGAPADWDGLAARGNPGWSWADVLPAYRAMEDHSLGASESRGAGGPLGVSVTDPGDEITAAVMASAVSYGWARVADANASDAERIGFTPSTISRGRRTTSTSSTRSCGATEATAAAIPVVRATRSTPVPSARSPAATGGRLGPVRTTSWRENTTRTGRPYRSANRRAASGAPEATLPPKAPPLPSGVAGNPPGRHHELSGSR